MQAAQKLRQISARIFGEVVVPPNVRSPTKYMRRPLIGDAVLDWHPQEAKCYPKVIKGLHLLGIYTDERLQYAYTRREYMIERGRPPVQKGQGRRAAKRK